MKTEKELSQLLAQIYEKTDECNDKCNEASTSEEKQEIFKRWDALIAQANLINHILYNTELKTLNNE